MAETSLSALWVNALKQYENSTQCVLTKSNSHERALGFPDASQNLEAFLEALQIRQDQFVSYRNEKRRVVSAFRKCILPLHFILDFADKTIQATPAAPASAIFFAVQHLLNACEKVSKAYDAVEELFRRVAAVTCSLEGYKESSLLGTHQTVVFEVLSCLLRIIGSAHVKIAKPSRLHQFGRSLFSNDEEITEGLAELERRVQDELGYVMRLNFGMTQQMNETTRNIHQEVLDIKKEITRSRMDQIEHVLSEAKTDMIEKLKNESWEEMRKHHRRTVAAIATATGTWIQDDSMFASWENGSGSVLWVFGRPGVGKTVLAAATVEALRAKYSGGVENPLSRPVAYLYFKEGQPKFQNLSHMFLALALQVAKQDERFQRHLTDAITTYPGILENGVSPESLWDRLFLSYDPSTENLDDANDLLYIIVDGLDEANDEAKHSFLTCLGRLLASQPSYERISIQVAVFARPEIRNLLETADAAFEGSEKIIDITEDKTQNDIRVYVRHQTKHIAAVRMARKMDPKQGLIFEAFIENSIVARSQGMFLWAKLVLDQIRDSPSAESVEEALNDAPSGLMDMIHMVFLRLNHEDEIRTRYLTHLLAWVLCCRRPLTIAELHVCLLETVGQRFITISDDLTERYASLFDVVQMSNEDNTSRTIGSNGSDNKSEVGDDSETDASDDEAVVDGYTPLRPSLEPFRWKRISVHANNGVFDEWHRSTVSFAHARFRDYLKQEGNPLTKKWDDCRVVPAHIDKFKMQMVKTLLDLAMKPIAQKYGVHLLKEYAADNCVSHLLEIDIATMPDDLCGPVGARLASLCFDGDRFYQIQNGYWHTTIDTWLLDDKKTSIVRGLIGKGIEYLDIEIPALRPWTLRAVESARVLLQPLISACARLWLGKRAWDDIQWFHKCETEIWVLLAYEYLTPEGDNTGPISVLRGTRRVGRIALHHIEQIARSQNLKEDEYWLTGVAWTIMQGPNATYTHRAMEYFQKAIEQAESRTRKLYGITKPTAWVAYEGLARCYGDNLRKPQLAVTTMDNAIKALPQYCVEIGVDSYFRARAAHWQLQMGADPNETTRVCKEAYDRCQTHKFGTDIPVNHVIVDSVKLYLEMLSRTQDYQSMAEVLHDLADRQTLFPGYSLLNCMLRHDCSDQEFKRLTGTIAIALYKTRDTELDNLLQDNFKKIAYIDTSGKPRWSDLRLAERSAKFLHRHFKDVTGSVKVYKSILSVIDSSGEAYRQRMKPIRDQSAAFLSLSHFTEAVEVKGSRRSGYSQAVEKLKVLAQEDRRQYRASYSALLYGVWLRDHRQKSPKVWRPIFQASISEAISSLYDDDPWNDDDAYAQLGEALMMGNDPENAAIALGIGMLSRDEIAYKSGPSDREAVSSQEQIENTIEPLRNEDANFKHILRCDGICDPNKDDFAELWCCCICEKTWLCGDCRLLLKNQDPEADRYVICSADHEHIKAYPLSDPAKAIVEALQRKDFDQHERWLRSVQASWNIDLKTENLEKKAE